MENYEEFLTDEDIFRLEMEAYIPEFMERMEKDTLREPDFIEKTIQMQELAESVGIDLETYMINFGKMQGFE